MVSARIALRLLRYDVEGSTQRKSQAGVIHHSVDLRNIREFGGSPYYYLAKMYIAPQDKFQRLFIEDISLWIDYDSNQGNFEWRAYELRVLAATGLDVAITNIRS